jgi:hypothetical protein
MTDNQTSLEKELLAVIRDYAERWGLTREEGEGALQDARSDLDAVFGEADQ